MAIFGGENGIFRKRDVSKVVDAKNKSMLIQKQASTLSMQ